MLHVWQLSPPAGAEKGPGTARQGGDKGATEPLGPPCRPPALLLRKVRLSTTDAAARAVAIESAVVVRGDGASVVLYVTGLLLLVGQRPRRFVAMRDVSRAALDEDVQVAVARPTASAGSSRVLSVKVLRGDRRGEGDRVSAAPVARKDAPATVGVRARLKRRRVQA